MLEGRLYRARRRAALAAAGTASTNTSGGGSSDDAEVMPALPERHAAKWAVADAAAAAAAAELAAEGIPELPERGAGRRARQQLAAAAAATAGPFASSPAAASVALQSGSRCGNGAAAGSDEEGSDMTSGLEGGMQQLFSAQKAPGGAAGSGVRADSPVVMHISKSQRRLSPTTSAGGAAPGAQGGAGMQDSGTVEMPCPTQDGGAAALAAAWCV